jgi:hypothetical protein
MADDSLKAWLEAMPIEEVRRKIETLERRLGKLKALERVYSDHMRGGPERDARDIPALPEQGAGGHSKQEVAGGPDAV